MCVKSHCTQTPCRSDRVCLLETSGCVLSSKTEMCPYPNGTMLNICRCTCRKRPGAQWIAQCTSKPLTVPRQGCAALSQQKLPETLKLLRVQRDGRSSRQNPVTHQTMQDIISNKQQWQSTKWFIKGSMSNSAEPLDYTQDESFHFCPAAAHLQCARNHPCFSHLKGFG